MSWSKPVFSKMINEVGWDSETQEMIVTFKNGRKAAYAGASEHMADELSRAASVGTMFGQEVKDRYAFRYI